MGVVVKNNVVTAAGLRLPRAVRLPDIPDARHVEPGRLDRLGELSRRLGRPLLPALTDARAGADDAGGAVRALRREHGVGLDEPIRFVSFNIRGAQGPPGPPRPSPAQLDAVANDIRRLRPDIVALQEVDDFAGRSLFADELNELAKRLSPTSAVAAAPIRQINGRSQMVGVMTFNGFQVQDARNLFLPDWYGDAPARRVVGEVAQALRHLHDAGKPVPRPSGGLYDYHPRNVLDAMVSTPAGQAVRVLSTHMTWPKPDEGVPSAAHQRQLAGIAPAIAAWDGPTLLGGDFNVRSNSAHYAVEAQAFERAGLRDTFTTRGVAPADPRRSSIPGEQNIGIDRIWASPHFAVDDVRVDRHEPISSDHYPVDAGLRLRG